MEIRLSTLDVFFFEHIEHAAKIARCFARIKWTTPRQVRFVLVERAMSNMPASVEQHDQVIGALLAIDTQATVRTARATYEGALDFEAQRKARIGVPAVMDLPL